MVEPPPAEEGRLGETLDLEEGTVVSLLESKRDEADEIGRGEAAGRPDFEVNDLHSSVWVK